MPAGLELCTTPVNPVSSAWYVDGDRATCPVTWGVNRCTTLPDGDTTAAATWGAYRVPPLAKVL